MKYEFEVFQMNVENHIFWVAKSKLLKGCIGQGDSISEAILELEENEESWLETAESLGMDIPVSNPRPNTNEYSGKVSLRIAKNIHQMSSELAKENGISLNQYFNDAIVYYNSLNSQRNFVNNSRSDYSNVISFRNPTSSSNYSFNSDPEEM